MGVTERPRALNPSKAIAMAIYPIIVHFTTWRARSMHDVACEFARAVVRSKDAQKQLARTSLRPQNLKTKTTHILGSPKLRPAGRQCDKKLSVGDKNFEAAFSVLDWHSGNWFRFKSKNFGPIILTKSMLTIVKG